jgi:hypothetical protein
MMAMPAAKATMPGKLIVNFDAGTTDTHYYPPYLSPLAVCNATAMKHTREAVTVSFQS